MNQLALDMIKRDEGFRSRPYDDATGKTVDCLGKITIGYGTNLSQGISKERAEWLCKEDIEKATEDARAVVGEEFDNLSYIRRAVMINMAYNLGRTRLKGFKKMLAAVRKGDFNTATKEMLNSKWAKQVGHRAVRLGILMELE